MAGLVAKRAARGDVGVEWPSGAIYRQGEGIGWPGEAIYRQGEGIGR